MLSKYITTINQYFFIFNVSNKTHTNFWTYKRQTMCIISAPASIFWRIIVMINARSWFASSYTKYKTPSDKSLIPSHYQYNLYFDNIKWLCHPLKQVYCIEPCHNGTPPILFSACSSLWHNVMLVCYRLVHYTYITSNIILPTTLSSEQQILSHASLQQKNEMGKIVDSLRDSLLLYIDTRSALQCTSAYKVTMRRML